MKSWARMAVFLTLVLGVSQPAWAVRTRFHVAAESPAYKEKMGGMIGRGVINVATFFVDLMVHTVNETKAGPPLIGTLTGFASGVGCSALRLSSGAVDVLTFWVPGFNGFAVSDSYQNCLAEPSMSAAAPMPATDTGSFNSYESTPESMPSAPAPSEAPKRTWKK